MPEYLQIVQTQDYVMLYAEVANSALIIPTRKRAHVPSNMRQWRGDSVGWWEGDTFAVETLNFKNSVFVRGFGVAPAGIIFTDPETGAAATTTRLVYRRASMILRNTSPRP